jgi:cytochrome c556
VYFVSRYLFYLIAHYSVCRKTPRRLPTQLANVAYTSGGHTMKNPTLHVMKRSAVVSFLVLIACTAVEQAPSADTQLEETLAQPDPGTLKAVMAGIAVDMDTVHAGMWAEDLVQVERAATSIANHPHVSAAERNRIQQLLGDEFSEFVAGDKRVHDAAVSLATAAAAGELVVVLAALGELESGCLSCHTTFRARLKPDATTDR